MLIHLTQLQDIKYGSIIQMASPKITWPNFKWIFSDAGLVNGAF